MSRCERKKSVSLRRPRGAQVLLGAQLLFGALSCSAGSEESGVQGALGVFYGGQVQERELIEWSPERAVPLGFRLSFPAGAEEPRLIQWQVVRPGPRGRRVTEEGEVRLPAEREIFDQQIALSPDSLSGTWNVRVTVQGILVIDRALLVQKAAPAAR